MEINPELEYEPQSINSITVANGIGGKRTVLLQRQNMPSTKVFGTPLTLAETVQICRMKRDNQS